MADKVFFIPQKPLTLIQAINRIGAATGSILHAGATIGADFNGHYNHLSWNNYRRYYVGEFFWAGRHVFARDEDFTRALEASIAEFDRQGAGATLKVYPREEDVVLAESHPRLREHGKEAEVDTDASWRTWQFDEINTAINMEKTFGVPHLIHLREAATPEDYKNRIDAEFKLHRGSCQV